METSTLPSPINPADKLDIQLRLGTKDDLPFIVSSWTQMTKHTYPNMFALDYNKHFGERIARLVNKSSVVVAHLDGEPNEIVGYIVYTTFIKSCVVHYTYVKLDARGQGISNTLLAFANPIVLPVVFTHPPKNENLMNKLCTKYIYDPYVLELMEQHV